MRSPDRCRPARVAPPARGPAGRARRWPAGTSTASRTNRSAPRRRRSAPPHSGQSSVGSGTARRAAIRACAHVYHAAFGYTLPSWRCRRPPAAATDARDRPHAGHRHGRRHDHRHVDLRAAVRDHARGGRPSPASSWRGRWPACSRSSARSSAPSWPRPFPTPAASTSSCARPSRPRVAFMWGWANFWSIHSGIIAAIAVVCARYIAYFVPLSPLATADRGGRRHRRHLGHQLRGRAGRHDGADGHHRRQARRHRAAARRRPRATRAPAAATPGR